MYKSKEEKAFRNLIGFVIPLPIAVHNEIHAQMDINPPQKPLKVERLECIEFVGDRDKWAHEDNPYWAIEAAMQYFVYRGADKPEHEERCSDTRRKLAQQIGIMAGQHTLEKPI